MAGERTGGVASGYDRGDDHSELTGAGCGTARHTARIRARLSGQEVGDPRHRAGAGDCESFDPGIASNNYAENHAIDGTLPFKGIPPVLSAAEDAPPMPARAEG